MDGGLGDAFMSAALKGATTGLFFGAIGAIFWLSRRAINRARAKRDDSRARSQVTPPVLTNTDLAANVSELGRINIGSVRTVDMAGSGMVSHKDEETELKRTTLNIESETLKRAKAPIPDEKTFGVGVRNNQIPGKESEATEECRTFPFSEELERKVYSYLLQQELDQVTMIRAKVKAEGDKDKTEAFYYKMKYQELQGSGVIVRFKEELLAEAHEREIQEMKNAHERRIQEIAKSLSLDQPLTVSACGHALSILGYALVEEEPGKKWAVNLSTGGTAYYYAFKNLEDFTRSVAVKALAALPDNSSGSNLKERFREALLLGDR